MYLSKRLAFNQFDSNVCCHDTAGSSSQLSNKTTQARRAQQGTQVRPQASAGGSSSCSTEAGRPQTMLRSPAALLPSRHMPQHSASSRQARGFDPLQVSCIACALLPHGQCTITQDP